MKALRMTLPTMTSRGARGLRLRDPSTATVPAEGVPAAARKKTEVTQRSLPEETCRGAPHHRRTRPVESGATAEAATATVAASTDVELATTTGTSPKLASGEPRTKALGARMTLQTAHGLANMPPLRLRAWHSQLW